MKGYLQKLCCSAGLILAVSMPGTAIAAPNTGKWVKVATDSKNQAWYVDSGTIRVNKGVRYFWSYVMAAQPYVESGKMVYGTAYYLSVDCPSKRYRLRFERLLDQNSRTLHENNYGDGQPLGTPPAGSAEEASVKYVCAWRK